MRHAIRNALEAIDRGDLQAALEALEPHEDPNPPTVDDLHLITPATAAVDWITLACANIRCKLAGHPHLVIPAIVPALVALRSALNLLPDPPDEH